MTDLVPKPRHEIQTPSDVHAERVLRFFDLDAVSDALHANEFDVNAEMERIVDLIGNPDPDIAIKALSHFHKVKMDLMKANGLMQTVAQTRTITEEDGSRTQQTVMATALLHRLQEGNQRDPRHLERHNPHKIIDAVPIEGESQDHAEHPPEEGPAAAEEAGEGGPAAPEGTDPEPGEHDVQHPGPEGAGGDLRDPRLPDEPGG